MDAAHAGPLEEPPARVVERATEIVPEHGRAPAGAGPARSGWSLARLVRDTFAAPLAYGVRSGAATAWRLHYRADEADVDLEISRGDDPDGGLRLTRQVLVPGSRSRSRLTAALWANGLPGACAEGDPLGIFVFDGILPETYQLEVWLCAEGRGIRIESVDLRKEEP